MCVRFGMQSIPVPAHFAFHATTEESSADRNQRLGRLRDTELSNAEVVLAAHRDLLPKGSVKHDAMAMGNSLLKESILPYHRTAAITACIIIIDMAIPLTRANRLAAMRDSDERITSIFTPFLRGPLRFTYALVYLIKEEGHATSAVPAT